ncbi:ATP-binding protein [Autumnicola psychrophila]|uniref:histidine kinase n=1 Tax=Autumnicola psychrophila TaxID=3075592 RepID=A0ABU3DWB9_9FLAO|nr:ATP-binding protein [Zunongwangia sp. F225]MDT0688031.1 ATP-binding protein [Zunongwangia sp. F225]
MNESSENLLNIIRSLPGALLILKPDFQIIYASNSYLRATKADGENIIGMHIFEAFPDNPENPNANGVKNLRASLEKVLSTGKPQKMQMQKYDVPLPNGTFEEKYWNVINTPVTGEAEEILYIIHSVEDVTEQVKTKAALELAVEAAQLGTWEIDLTTGKFTHRNLRHDLIYGFDNFQPVWNHEIARNKILAEDVKIYDCAFSEAVKTGHLDFEVKTKWEDGSIHWLEIKGKVYFSETGEPNKAAGVNIDVTEQRRTEEALRKAKKEAESAAMAKDEFLSVMSHEIRTPLNAVIGLSNLLLDNNPREDQKSNMESLQFAAGNLLHLINDILDFSKIEAGRMDISEENFDLTDLIYNLIRTHEPKASEKGIELMLTLEESVPTRICADPFLLTQVLHNLVGNAIKFTEKGEVGICVEFAREEQEKKWLKFSVRDTGKGIAADKLDYIFEKFAQQRKFSEGNIGGTGLGLSITKSLIELMGGSVEVESTPGKGSNFWFYLPINEANSFKAEGKQQKAAEEEHLDLSEKNVLIVEDVEINRNILIQYLKKWWNLSPEESESGEKAIEMVQQKKYDIILMDLRMPKMDGYETSEKIREINGYQETPILAFTAETKNNLKGSHLFDDTIFKPFEPGDLKQKIQKHLVSFGNKRVRKSSNKNRKEEKKTGIDIFRFEKMAEGNGELLKKFISGSVLAFETYRKDFLAVEDEETLSDLIHRNTMNIYYANANLLKNKIEAYREKIAQEREGANGLKVEKEQIGAEFERVITHHKNLL